MGRSNAGHSGTDSMLITGQTYSHFIYRLDWSSSSGFAISRVGAAALNQSVCAGGGLSGEVCNARVHRINVTGPTNHGPGYFARTSAPSIPLGGQGDSGGPSYSINPTNGQITLLGMLQSAYASDGTGSCPGGNSNPWNVSTVPQRRCFWNIFFVNQAAIASALGVAIVTGS
jgi:hypothetical protein